MWGVYTLVWFWYLCRQCVHTERKHSAEFTTSGNSVSWERFFSYLATLYTFTLVFCLCWEVVGKFGCFLSALQWKAAKKAKYKNQRSARPSVVGALFCKCIQQAAAEAAVDWKKNYVKQKQKKRSFSSRVYVCMYIVFVCVLCNETETGKRLLLMKTSEMCKCNIENAIGYWQLLWSFIWFSWFLWLCSDSHPFPPFPHYTLFHRQRQRQLPTPPTCMCACAGCALKGVCMCVCARAFMCVRACKSVRAR